MSEPLAAAIELRNRIADDASRAKDRDEHLRLVARYHEANRLVEMLTTAPSV